MGHPVEKCKSPLGDRLIHHSRRPRRCRWGWGSSPSSLSPPISEVGSELNKVKDFVALEPDHTSAPMVWVPRIARWHAWICPRPWRTWICPGSCARSRRPWRVCRRVDAHFRAFFSGKIALQYDFFWPFCLLDRNTIVMKSIPSSPTRRRILVTRNLRMCVLWPYRENKNWITHQSMNDAK